MADKDIPVVVKDIHERVESARIDLHRDDGCVWKSLCELSGFGALAGTVVDDRVVVPVWDRLNDGTARGILDAEGWGCIEKAREMCA